MKKTIALVTLLLSFGALACGQPGAVNSLCPGDTVHPDGWTHSQGGKVVSYNPSTGVIKVRSSSTGKTFNFGVRELGVTKGCLDHVCVGDMVHPDAWTHSQGANVVSINPHTRNIKVLSRSTGKTMNMSSRDLGLARGCSEGICVGDIVSPDSWTHSQGANVVSINPVTRVIKVLSRSTGKTANMAVRELGVMNYCADYSNDQRYSPNYY